MTSLGTSWRSLPLGLRSSSDDAYPIGQAHAAVLIQHGPPGAGQERVLPAVRTGVLQRIALPLPNVLPGLLEEAQELLGLWGGSGTSGGTGVARN